MSYFMRRSHPEFLTYACSLTSRIPLPLKLPDRFHSDKFNIQRHGSRRKMPDLDDVLGKEQWRLEAQAVINDVKSHVQDIRVSEQLTSTNKVIYLNLITLEGLQLCVELSASGFTIVGNHHDDASNTGNKHFETPYCLLEYISPRYRQSFCSSLLKKLEELQDQQ